MRTTLRKTTEVVTIASKPFQYEPKWASPNVLDVKQGDLPSLKDLPKDTRVVIIRLDNSLQEQEKKSLGLLSDALGTGAVILYNVKESHKSELSGTNLAQRLFYADKRKEAITQARTIVSKMSRT